MAHITYRTLSPSAPASTTNKDAALTIDEVDGNFKSLATNLNLLSSLAISPVLGSVIYGNGTDYSFLSPGTSGHILQCNGSAAPTWVSPPSSLPSQTSNNGKYLTTNGSVASWATVSAGGLTPTDDVATNSSFYPSLLSSVSGSQSTCIVSSTKLYFNPNSGTLSSTLFTSLSDERSKTNITNITNALGVVQQLQGVEFNWKDNGQKSSGVIAQRLEEVLPHLVSESDGVKSVNYAGIIAYLIEAVNELSAKLEERDAQ